MQESLNEELNNTRWYFEMWNLWSTCMLSSITEHCGFIETLGILIPSLLVYAMWLFVGCCLDIWIFDWNWLIVKHNYENWYADVLIMWKSAFCTILMPSLFIATQRPRHANVRNVTGDLLL